MESVIIVVKFFDVVVGIVKGTIVSSTVRFVLCPPKVLEQESGIINS